MLDSFKAAWKLFAAAEAKGICEWCMQCTLCHAGSTALSACAQGLLLAELNLPAIAVWHTGAEEQGNRAMKHALK